MRLLIIQRSGGFGHVEVDPDDSDMPPYAVLSHTWGADGEEFLFKDLMEGTGKNKPGYRKVEFCGKRAASDGLKHFWVDTCCIDKSSSAEVSENINSMFKFYSNASKCYVYLSDVSKSSYATNYQSSSAAREYWSFRDSRWFRRGWTLQELLAPASVEFFSRECYRLGSKTSLEQQIHKITGISVRALRGQSLQGFGIEERLSWAENRETKRQEDKAYSLLGIFDIQMPLLYGAGREKAFARLRREIDTSQLSDSRSELTGIGASMPTTSTSSRSDVDVWKPRYYFFYGFHANNQNAIAYSLGLTKPPILYRAYVKGYSVAHVGSRKVLLDGPANAEAKGVACKIENEWQESQLILGETEDYFPGSCMITYQTGDGWSEIEGRTFKYSGPATELTGVSPGASPFKELVASNLGDSGRECSSYAESDSDDVPGKRLHYDRNWGGAKFTYRDPEEVFRTMHSQQPR